MIPLIRVGVKDVVWEINFPGIGNEEKLWAATGVASALTVKQMALTAVMIFLNTKRHRLWWRFLILDTVDLKMRRCISKVFSIYTTKNKFQADFLKKPIIIRILNLPTLPGRKNTSPELRGVPQLL